MRYISLDIETTGLNKQNCNVLQVAAVVDDLKTPVSDLPRFVSFISHDTLNFEPYALDLHIKSGLLSRYLADKEKRGLDATFAMLLHFLDKNYPLIGKEKYILAGKNLAGFDLPFLCAGNAPSNATLFVSRSGHRILDPATFFTDLFSDSTMPSLDQCKARCGIFNKGVTHDALDDAIDVVTVMRQIAIQNRNRYI